MVARYEYDVFGAIRFETGTSDNVRKFTGKEYERDVRLYYFARRYCDPYIARFNQRDPAGDGGNWYAYARNNPLKFVDPTGLRARGVDAREEAALRRTFGEEVGNFLINTIDIDFDENVKTGRIPKGSYSLILLKIDYNSEKLGDLALFIHEATHIWQKNTGLHRGGADARDYDYSYQQLSSLDLKREEHAETVREWFYVSYGRSEDLISVKAGWNYILPRFGFQSNDPMIDFQANPWQSAQNLDRFVDHFYNPVIQEIRNSNLLLPALWQNFPNPF